MSTIILTDINMDVATATAPAPADSIQTQTTPSDAKASTSKSMSPEEKAAKEALQAEREKRRAAKEAREKEKQAKRDKELKVQEAGAKMMKSFFKTVAIAKKNAEEQKTITEFEATFKPFNDAKAGLEVAPINAFSSKRKKPFDPATLDSALTESPGSLADLLQDFASSRRPRASTSKLSTRRCRSSVSVREVMDKMAMADVLGSVNDDALHLLQDRSKVPMKFLHFSTDFRPPWYGTWTKSSELIGPRRPFGQDPIVFDYGYDSEAEWEENEENEDPKARGEDVMSQDGDESSRNGDVGDSDDEDGWLVDDDEVEYEEGAEPMDVDDERLSDPFRSGSPSLASRASPAKKVINMLPVTKKPTSKLKPKSVLPRGRKFTAPLVPFHIGPRWEDRLGEPSEPTFAPFRIEFLNDASVGLDPFTFTSSTPRGSGQNSSR